MAEKYVVSTAATLQAVSVEEVADHCRVTNTEDYAKLANLILEATDYLQKRLSRQFLTATWKLYLDSFPDEICIEKLPVASITSITYTDEAGTTQTLAAANYQTDLIDCGYPARIRPAYGMTWPDVRADTYNAICITFVAGWTSAAAVPQSIKLILLLLVAHSFEFREPLTPGMVNPLPWSLEHLVSMEDWNQTP